MSRIRIVVADHAEAIFYDTPALDARPKEVGRISDPVAHLHDRDLVSDRPGRSYESVGGARHAITRENDPRRQEAARFARRIALPLQRRRQIKARKRCRRRKVSGSKSPTTYGDSGDAVSRSESASKRGAAATDYRAVGTKEGAKGPARKAKPEATAQP